MKRGHPYRTDARDRAHVDGPLDLFEERAIGVVLLAAGASGIAIGFGAPAQNATELALGLILAFFGLWTLFHRSERLVV